MSVLSEITKHLPGRPEGDPDALREAASCWNSVAGGLRTTIGDANSRIGTLSASWQGEAKSAFEQEWLKLVRATNDGCDEIGQAANSLTAAAERLAAAQRKYDILLASAAIATGITIAASFITFGGAAAVEGGEIVVEAGEAVALGAEAAEAASSAFSIAVGVAEQMAFRFVVAFGTDLAAQAGLDAVAYPGQDPLGHLDVGAALGVAIGLATPNLEFRSLVAKIAANGLVGAGSDALSQEVSSGKVDPISVLFSGLQGAAGAAAIVGVGKAFSSFASDAKDAAAAAEAAQDAEGAELEDLQALELGPDGSSAADIPPEFRPQDPSGEYTRPSGVPGGEPGGSVTQIPDSADANNVRSLGRENDSARIAAADGYDVVQNPTPDQVKAAAISDGDDLVDYTNKNPDLLIEGHVFDVYAPQAATPVGSIELAIIKKIDRGQTQRVMINLQDWHGNVTDLQQELAEFPIADLKEVKLILPNQSIMSWSSSLGGWTY